MVYTAGKYRAGDGLAKNGTMMVRNVRRNELIAEDKRDWRVEGLSSLDYSSLNVITFMEGLPPSDGKWEIHVVDLLAHRDAHAQRME